MLAVISLKTTLVQAGVSYFSIGGHIIGMLTTSVSLKSNVLLLSLDYTRCVWWGAYGNTFVFTGVVFFSCCAWARWGGCSEVGVSFFVPRNKHGCIIVLRVWVCDWGVLVDIANVIERGVDVFYEDTLENRAHCVLSCLVDSAVT